MPMITRPALFLLMLAAVEAQAADQDRGRLLYENFCYHCHLAEIHFRVNSKIDGWTRLLETVNVWQEEMGLGWREEDVRDVASYLNARHYRLAEVFPSER